VGVNKINKWARVGAGAVSGKWGGWVQTGHDGVVQQVGANRVIGERAKVGAASGKWGGSPDVKG